jgi:hypothetical protein
MELLLCLDMLFEWRLLAHSWFAELFLERNLYNGRRNLQLVLLSALALLLLLALRASYRHFRGRRGATLASSGLCLSLTLYAMEIISMHETDHALYHLVSGVMVIAYLWALSCALTFAGAMIEARSGGR